ncbi:MAG: hypothetical protein IPG32_16970 [Saprospirales bacterium]|nr:hypothetical protein [Saprospirales bacterium]
MSATLRSEPNWSFPHLKKPDHAQRNELSTAGRTGHRQFCHIRQRFPGAGYAHVCVLYRGRTLHQLHIQSQIRFARRRPLDPDLRGQNSDDFSPGVSIKVNVGYQTQTTTIFEGFVIATGVKVKEGTHSQLTVECVGNAYRMTVSRKTRYFMDMDDSDIISDVISSYNSVSMGTVESSSVRHKSLVQYNSSDWDFILMRAEATGMIVNSHDNQVSVNKPRMNESPSLSWNTAEISSSAISRPMAVIRSKA